MRSFVWRRVFEDWALDERCFCQRLVEAASGEEVLLGCRRRFPIKLHLVPLVFFN